MRWVVPIAVIIITWFCFIPKATSTMAVLKQKPPSASYSSSVKVINALLAKIEGGYVYTKDGRKFPVPPGTKIIDMTKSRKGNRLKIITLIFKKDRLISIVIR